jgi:hypothetical protein
LDEEFEDIEELELLEDLGTLNPRDLDTLDPDVLADLATQERQPPPPATVSNSSSSIS